MTDTKRKLRGYGTSEVVVAFARYGVALATIARALVIGTDQARNICARAEASGELQMMPPELPTDTRSASLSELVHLRSELDEARVLIRELQDTQDGVLGEFVGVANLTGKEAAMVGLLAKHGRVTRARLYDSIYGMRHDDEQPEPKIVDVFLSKIRKKLTPREIKIETIWGVGYSMTPENVEKLRALAKGGTFERRPTWAEINARPSVSA